MLISARFCCFDELRSVKTLDWRSLTGASARRLMVFPSGCYLLIVDSSRRLWARMQTGPQLKGVLLLLISIVSQTKGASFLPVKWCPSRPRLPNLQREYQALKRLHPKNRMSQFGLDSDAEIYYSGIMETVNRCQGNGRGCG